MRIATWNVNSARQRAGHLVRFLKERAPDVVCLQEIKCVDEAFPHAEVEAAGYNVAVHGQKGFNGVAILSRAPIETVRGLPGDPLDEQARYIEAVVPHDGAAVRVASLYLPNGNPPDSNKYAYKLAWMDRLTTHARALLKLEEPLVLAGDYNVIPADEDCYDPVLWAHDALGSPQTRGRFRALLNLGFVDALRATSEEAGIYTFWDYQAGAWQRNRGLRIDHALLSPQAADRLVDASVDRARRGEDRPSDHVPLIVELR